MNTETNDAERIRIHKLWQEKLEADPWNGWRAMIAGWEIEGTKVPVDPNVPFQGYFRSRLQDKTFEPVHFYMDNSVVDNPRWVVERPWRAEHERTVIEGGPKWQRIVDSWIYISRYPVSVSFYKKACADKAWPDQDTLTTSEALAASSKPNVEAAAAREAVIGDNQPPEPIDIVLRNKIDNALSGLKTYPNVEDTTALAKVLSLKNLLTELRGQAENERDKLSRPHLDELQVIRNKWSPLVNDADGGAKTLQKLMDDFATAQLKLQREEEQRLAKIETDRIAEEARVARVAEQQRIANESNLIFDERAVKPAPTPPAPPPTTPVRPAPTQAPATKIAPSYGRAANIKAKMVVTEITDIKALFAFMTTPTPHPELVTKMLELAQRAQDAGYPVPGVRLDEVAKVRS